MTAPSLRSRLTGKWLALPGNLRGIVLISVGTVLFALTDIVSEGR